MREADLIISVIVPCYNAGAYIDITCKRIKKNLEAGKYKDYEMIFVNDGSQDNTLNILYGMAAMDNKVKVINLSKNFGQVAATSAGIENCGGDVAIIIDDDLQDPPELFQEMIKRYTEEQCNVLYGVRKTRKGEGALKKVASRIFYRVLKILAEDKIPVDTGDFRLIDRKVINVYKSFKEKYKLVRGVIAYAGFKQLPFYYDRDARVKGESHFNHWVNFGHALKVIYYCSKIPLKLSMALGFISIIIGLVLAIYTIVGYIILGNKIAPGWASIVVIIVFFGGIQLFVIGIIGEYIANIFDEVRDRPPYIVEERKNFDNENVI